VSKPDNPTRTRIKVCGLTREQDVETACTAGVDTIGFVLYEHSPRFVAPARAAELARLLPAFVQPVLLFVNPTNEWFLSACSLVDSALVQFHGDETPERCAELAKMASRRWIKAARIPQKNDVTFDLLEFAAHYKAASAILLDTLAAVLSEGLPTNQIDQVGKGSCTGCSQVFIVFDPRQLGGEAFTDQVADSVADYVNASTPAENGKEVLYPGQSTLRIRTEHRANGVVVDDGVWAEVLALAGRSA